MDTIHRIAAFDVGNKNTGVVVVDTTTPLTILHMDCITASTANEMMENVMSAAKTIVEPLLTGHDHPFIVYENIYTPKGGYRNFTVIGINKAIRKHFEGEGYKVKSLLASQKLSMIPGTRNRQRKKAAQEAVTNMLEGDTLTEFQSHERCHDIADAFLMVAYLVKNPKKLK